jgi:hypothetical protein
MSARSWLAVATISVAVLSALVACGSKGDRRFDSDTDPTNAAEGGAAPAKVADGGAAATSNGSSPGVGYPDGGCNPFDCKSGCCTAEGKCLAGTAPAQCGKGGLVCMNCAAIGYGCVNQGCAAAATCAGCDGCCKAGTCNPNGKTQDSACGHGGAVCVDCTSSSQTCDGNGNCH